MNLTRSSSLWNIVFIMTMIVYAAGLFIDIMEPDAAVYAEVSMEMHDRHDLLSIYHKGADWLDKPHFPFWMSAISYNIFGVNTFAYKLPAVLFVLLGALYTFLFARRFYSSLHGFIAVLILITAQHIIISNQDVRAEPFLTGLLIMGLYHFVMALENQGATRSMRGAPRSTGVGHIIAGSFAVAALIMTKGLFTVIPIAAGIGLSLLYSKNYKSIFSWYWLLALVFIIIFLSPSLYGYYLQFDQHPEKIIFGKQDVSGVEFFLWTSQWGRFTNTGPITGKGDISYFVHTMLWAFLPWAFMAFFAIFRKTKKLITRTSATENYTYFGFITLFLIFSASKFQLSFYLNPLFSLLAIFTAAAMLDSGIKTLKIFSRIHFVLCCLLVVGVVALHYFFFSGWPQTTTIVVVTAGVIFGFYLFAANHSYLKKIFFATAIICLSINFYLSREFYPALLKYQAESEAAHFIKANNIPADQVVFAGEMQSVADVILHYTTTVFPVENMNTENVSDKYVFTSPEGKNKIDSLQLQYKVINQFPDFPVTRINGKFINKNTRASELQQKYLLKVGAIDVNKPIIEISLAR